MGKLSSGFAGSSTRSLEDVCSEIERRLALPKDFKADAFNPTKMDVFTDDFSGDGARELGPGQRVKDRGFDQAPHDDFDARANRLKDERWPTEGGEPEGREVKSPNARFDSHQTDPATLRAELMAAAGNAKDQAPMDALDAREGRRQRATKPQGEAFPGARLDSEEHEYTGEVGPEEFHRRVLKKLMASGKL